MRITFLSIQRGETTVDEEFKASTQRATGDTFTAPPAADGTIPVGGESA